MGAAVDTSPHEALVRIEMDLEAWPLVCVCPHGRPDDEQMREFLQRFRAMEEERVDPYVLVLDLRYCPKISPAQRKMLTDDMAEPGQDSQCKAMAMIFESKILRGILTAIFWVRRPPYPLRVFNTPFEANVWALAQLEASPSKRAPGWYVQADASSKLEKAHEILKKMEAAQLSAHIARTEVGERRFFVPRAGPFADMADARVAGERLSREAMDTRLMRLYDDDADAPAENGSGSATAD